MIYDETEKMSDVRQVNRWIDEPNVRVCVDEQSADLPEPYWPEYPVSNRSVAAHSIEDRCCSFSISARVCVRDSPTTILEMPARPIEPDREENGRSHVHELASIYLILIEPLYECVVVREIALNLDQLWNGSREEFGQRQADLFLHACQPFVDRRVHD